MADSGAVEKLKVFISYSRKDSAEFADELVLGLEDRGFAPFLDRHDIMAGEPWEARLGALIEQSDTVIFVISPESVKSERCVWEIDKALGLSKRLLPVVYKTVEEKQIPAKLSDLQFVRFDTAPGMTLPLRELTRALRVDFEWIREHTRLGELGQRWQSRNRSEDLLLRGDDLVAAKAWSAKRKPDAPEITELQRSFLRASERAEIARAAESKVARRGTFTYFLKKACGVIFVIFGPIALFWNETSAIYSVRSLDEGARFVVEGDPNRIDPTNEGKLVHVSGELKTTARLADPDFAMSAEAARLVRDAEMYYWNDANQKLLHWRRSEPYETVMNSVSKMVPSRHVAARDATLGAFRPGKSVLEKLPATIALPIEPATVEAARTYFGGPVEVTNVSVGSQLYFGSTPTQLLYLGSNPAQPQIGDIRISWRIAKTGPVSLIGRQDGTDLVAFQTSRDRLLLVRSGTLSAMEMFKIEGQDRSHVTWRLIGGCFILAGWVMVLGLGRLVPALLVGGLIGLAAIAGAWLQYRPFEAAIALMVIGIAATIAIIRRWLPRFVPATRAG